jgi:hypothetical protein
MRRAGSPLAGSQGVSARHQVRPGRELDRGRFAATRCPQAGAACERPTRQQLGPGNPHLLTVVCRRPGGRPGDELATTDAKQATGAGISVDALTFVVSEKHRRSRLGQG